MTEADRLQKIVQTQERELRRLRKLISTARVAQVEYVVDKTVDPPVLQLICTCIGVDEYHFVEKCKPELEAVASAICQSVAELKMATAADGITGEKLDGAVSPGSAADEK